MNEEANNSNGPNIFITRKCMKVNRSATCWLIKRFIDPYAIILFVNVDEVVTEQNRLNAVGFDAPGATYPHEDALGRCSFNAMVLDSVDLSSDPVLVEMACIIQAADRPDQALEHPAASGLKLICSGFPEVSQGDDSLVMEKTKFLYDSLYASIHRKFKK